MKLPIIIRSIINSSLLCTTLVSTLCLVLCFENESESPHIPSLKLKENLDHSLWPSLNDRVALKELYEMYRDAAPLWKRAPSAGFYGMRGKKVPGQNFFGMRGKKGPSGFLGMRGKKMEPKLMGLADDLDTLESAVIGDLWSSKEYLQQPQTLVGGGGDGDNLLADHSDNKRAPADGFIGLRGKRNTNLKKTFTAPIH